MRRDALDRLLAGDPPLLPSSGFAQSVMEAVQREASAPPPLPFPWLPALPGLVALAAVVAAGVRYGVSIEVVPAAVSMDDWFASLVGIAMRPAVGPLVVAMLTAILPLAESFRLMRHRW